MVLPELEAGDEEAGEAVVAALLDLQIEDGEGAGRKYSGRVGWSQASTWRSGTARPAQLGDELRGPGARADDEAAGLVASAGRAHPHASAPRAPIQHRLAAMNLGAVCQRLLDVRDVASLGQQEPALGLVQAQDLLRQAVPWKAPVQLGAVHHLVRQAVELARFERALEDRAAFGARIHAAGDVKETLAGEALELAPQLVGAPQERHVRGMLPVGEPDDAGEPVGRAVLVHEVEALESEHPQAPAGEMEQRRAAHPPET